MAIRLGIDPLMVLQNTYIVHGKPGIEAKLAIALINSSGLFTSSLDYETVGDDPTAKDYRVRAFAVRKGQTNPTYGPWVDWAMVNAEGWYGKAGSKWKTMPSLMFMYRAATFFGRFHCPERLMGMQTADELHDVAEPAPKRIASKVSDATPATPTTPMDLNQAMAEERAAESSPAESSAPVATEADTGEAADIAITEIVESLGDWNDAKPKLRREFVKAGGEPKNFDTVATKWLGLVPEKADPKKWAGLLLLIQARDIDFKTGAVLQTNSVAA